MARKTITLENMNPNVKHMGYAISGPLLTRVKEIEEELKNNVSKPFKEILRADIEDNQSICQQPLTFLRQYIFK